MKDVLNDQLATTLQLTNLVVCMLVFQYQTPNFRQKRWLRRPEAMSGIILPTKKIAAACKVQKGQKRCGKLLKGKFATNLNKHIISTRF